MQFYRFLIGVRARAREMQSIVDAADGGALGFARCPERAELRTLRWRDAAEEQAERAEEKRTRLTPGGEKAEKVVRFSSGLSAPSGSVGLRRALEAAGT